MTTRTEPLASTESRGRRRVERGPTGVRTAANIRRLRTARGLTVRELSTRLGDVGRPIQASSLTNVEGGSRDVDVDDLLALAAVLGCSPLTLLLDLHADDRPLPITTERVLTAQQAWGWARGVLYVTPDGEVGWTYPSSGEVEPDLRAARLAHEDERRLWNRECRPDDPEADPADLADALADHREILDALADADAAAEEAGVPTAVVTAWLTRKRAERRLAARGPRVPGKRGKRGRADA